MTSKVAKSVKRGLEQALSYVRGEAEARRFRVTVPDEIDVRAIRVRLKMSQEEFSSRFGFSVNTLRHWEQGKRRPEGSARAYLTVIAKDPKSVQKALSTP